MLNTTKAFQSCLKLLIKKNPLVAESMNRSVWYTEQQQQSFDLIFSLYLNNTIIELKKWLVTAKADASFKDWVESEPVKKEIKRRKAANTRATKKGKPPETVWMGTVTQSDKEIIDRYNELYPHLLKLGLISWFNVEHVNKLISIFNSCGILNRAQSGKLEHIISSCIFNTWDKYQRLLAKNPDLSIDEVVVLCNKRWNKYTRIYE